jgi:hypothetical protein
VQTCAYAMAGLLSCASGYTILWAWACVLVSTAHPNRHASLLPDDVPDLIWARSVT